MIQVQPWQVAIAFMAVLLGGGGLGALLRVRSRNQLDQANSAVALATAYGKLIDQLEKRIEHMESRISALETENTALHAEVYRLTVATGGASP